MPLRKKNRFAAAFKEGSKKAFVRYVRSSDPDVLEATWRYAMDTLERVPYPDPERFKVVLQERVSSRPDAMGGHAEEGAR